ncbi:methyl-accepting chemotaxis protein [Anaerosporobacter faecicola]|uniref:methyl-accepting chemotaxis protein n=1 Tax=Anaerosporobacter faecicola TaxID=2718714 RepID=UPI00143A2C8B|nr:methyl-accepting chemotaxis protein [Anaerosporobacter faecicola]
MMKEGKVEMKFTLRKKITCMVLVPILIIGFSAIAASTNIVTKMINKEIKNQLNAASLLGFNHYQSVNEADYYVDIQGTLKKGVVPIKGDNSVVEMIKSYTGVDASFFYGDTRMATTLKDESGNLMVDTKIDEAVYEEVFTKGNKYFAKDINLGGKQYYGYYIPINQPSTGEIVGCFFTGKPSEEVTSQINSIKWQIFIITLLVGIVTMLLITIVINFINKGLKKSVKQLQAVSKGDLSATDYKRLKRTDEISEIANATTDLQQSLRNVIGQILNSVHGLHEAAEKISNTSSATKNTVDIVERAVSDISKGAMAQAEETTQANEHVMVMGTNIMETVNDVNDLTERASLMKQSGGEAIDILEELRATNMQTKEAIEMISNQTNTTNLSAQKIREATNIITDIAEETNLLSLNASIEAARAGEQGRGFAVVAAQIQKLAEQSDHSAKQIQEIISILLMDSNKAVETMNMVTEIINKQSEKVEISKEKVDSVNEGIHSFTNGIIEIKERTSILDKEREQIVDAVESLTAIAQQNAASAEETSASTGELASTMDDVAEAVETLRNISETLTKEVQVFKM